MKKIILLVVIVELIGCFFWLGEKLVKYNYPDSLASAKNVPNWMIDGYYDTFTDADMIALRAGKCSHSPIFVRQKVDGSAVLTCGIPAWSGSITLFVVDVLELNNMPAQSSTFRGSSSGN